jgi:hypothetical protein
MSRIASRISLLVALFSTLGVSPLGADDLGKAAEWVRKWDRDGDQRLSVEELAAAFPDAEVSLKFIRTRMEQEDAKHPDALETAIVSFFGEPDESGKRVQVDLIGAVHVADRSYYEELNRRFRDYDSVLYELVAPEGTRVPRGGHGGGGHPVSQIQTTLKKLLELSFQLEEVDYTTDNLVHADLSPEEFQRKMEQRGESFFKLLMRMMTAAAAQTDNKSLPSDKELIFAFFSPNRALQLKRVMARQFENLEAQMNLIQGPDGSTIITERNKRALEVLKRRLEEGDGKIAIFYGAGHMSDFAERLQQEFQLSAGETQWLQAWNLRD